MGMSVTKVTKRGGGGATARPGLGVERTYSELVSSAAVLYFGCRKREVDFLYRTEMTEAENDGVLSELNVAFSREQAKKEYVQHLIANDGTLSHNLTPSHDTHTHTHTHTHTTRDTHTHTLLTRAMGQVDTCGSSCATRTRTFTSAATCAWPTTCSQCWWRSPSARAA
jgi:hypothetical protein